jgi:quercetin dioxygenase-like cupin family protein
MFTPHSTPTQILGIGHVPQSPTWRTLPTHHGHHKLICVLQGCIHVAGNGRTYQGKAGDLFLYPAGVQHEERTVNL